MPLTQPKNSLSYLRSEKSKAEQKLRSCQHREKILERQMSKLNRRERVHRLCTRAGMLESFLVCPGELTDDQVMELLKISFRQPEVVLALAKMVHDVHERSNVQNHPKENCIFLALLCSYPFARYHITRMKKPIGNSNISNRLIFLLGRFLFS